MIQRILLLVCFTMSIAMSAQGLDFEQTDFEIKAVAMQKQKSALSNHVSEKKTPSRFNLGPALKDNKVTYSPIVETSDVTFTTTNTKSPDIKIAPSKPNQASFGNDGGINGVKNIAYKASSGGNIHDAYCRSVYASGSSN